MIIQIKGRGLVMDCFFDDEDCGIVLPYKWRIRWTRAGHRNYYYAETGSSGTSSLQHMHRLVLGLSPDSPLQVDHKNHNTLDNRKENLRACLRSQNQRNRIKHKATSSIYKGVAFNKSNNKWQAYICASNQNVIHLGYFLSEKEAAVVYDNKARELFGEYANCNF